MLIERFQEHLTEFLNTVEPTDAPHLAEDLYDMRRIWLRFRRELIDAILVETYRHEEIGKIAAITGYSPEWIAERIRIANPALIDPESTKRTKPKPNNLRRQEARAARNRIKRARPSRENLITEGTSIWLMDPLFVPNRKYAIKMHREVENLRSASVPSQIRWEIPEYDTSFSP